ncbi:MAG: hypothetical protein E7623_04090 [Ruminococcaceae bacterium]|nr:hypothetical protein [Oscillospiraceae bacterium]
MKKIIIALICLTIVLLSFNACHVSVDEKDPYLSLDNEKEEIISDLSEKFSEKESEKETLEEEEKPFEKEKESETVPEPISEAPVYSSASGSIKSNSGTYLNLRSDWTAESENGKDYTVKIEIYLEHMSLFVSERYTSLELGGSVHEYKINAVHEEIDGKLFSDLVLSYEIKTNSDALEKGINLKTSYPFRGIYGGQQIDTIFLEGTIKI